MLFLWEVWIAFRFVRLAGAIVAFLVWKDVFSCTSRKFGDGRFVEGNFVEIARVSIEEDTEGAVYLC